MTDGRRETPIKIISVETEADDLVLTAETKVVWSDPRMVAEAATSLQNVAFPRPGEYRFQLCAAEEFLLERRLVLAEITTGNANGSETDD
jgi:hypothetical protein